MLASFLRLILVSAIAVTAGKHHTFLWLISTSQRTSIRVAIEGSIVLSKSVEIDTAVGVGRRMVGEGRETASRSRVGRY